MSKIITIIPAFNEEPHIANVIKKINKVFRPRTILVINDCSNDKTSQIAKSMGAVVIDLPVKLNYGATIQTGFKYAFREGYDIVVLLDGDEQHEPAYIPKMVELVEKGQYDIVIGSRFIKKTGYFMPFFRKLGSLFFSWLIKIVTRKKIYDPTSGYQVFNRKIIEIYSSEYFPDDYPDADVVLMLILRKMKIYEFSMEMKQSTGKSMHTIFSSLYYPFKVTLSILTTVLRLEKLGGGK